MLAAPLLAFVMALAGRAQTNPHNTPADRAAGQKIYRSHCARCHGLNGAGGLGPNLASGVFYHGTKDAELFKNISEGIPGTAMPSQFFGETQVWQIVAYVRSMSQSGAAVTVKGDAAHGEQLFAEKGCRGCHIARGDGGVRGPDLTLVGSQRSLEYLRQSILDPGAEVSREFWVAKVITKDGQSRSGFLMNEDTYMIQILDFQKGLMAIPRSQFKDYGVDKGSAMPSYKGKLSDAELDDVVAYLASLKRQKENSK